jgi:hypothetical protein
LIIKVLII